MSPMPLLWKRRTFRWAGVIAALLAVVGIATGFETTIASIQTGETPLATVSQFTVPLPEISAFARAPESSEGHLRVHAVGDHEATISTFEIDLARKTLTLVQDTDLKEPISKRFSLCNSMRINECRKMLELITTQWEGVAQDASKRFFLLHEPLATLLVYNPQTQNVDSIINFEHFDLSEKQREKSVKELKENALGEGLVLLNNGHILVAKERSMAAIVEFGHTGEKAQGFSKQTLLDTAQSFNVARERDKMEPLHSWRMPKGFAECDLSEIQEFAGQLYILSQECHMIARVAPLVVSEQEKKKPRMHFEATWSLPQDLSGAEAFVVIDPETFLIGLDKRSTNHPNVFLMKAIGNSKATLASPASASSSSE
jgi:hypothetical protein